MILDGMPGRVEKNYPLNQLTTWKIGGPAETAYWPQTKEDLSTVWQRAQAAEVPVWLIGQGSNLLLPDEGLPGITVVTTYLRKVEWLSLIHISEPTRLGMISYAVFCLKK